GTRKVIHAVSELWLVALTVSGKLHHNDAIARGEVRNIVAPRIGVLCPAMNQHQRFIALAVVQIVNATAIELGKLRLSLRTLCTCDRKTRKTYAQHNGNR